MTSRGLQSLQRDVERSIRAFSFRELVEMATEATARSAIRRGIVTRMFRDVYVPTLHAESFGARAAAASRWRHGTAALAGASALYAWSLVSEPPEPLTMITHHTGGLQCPSWVRVSRVTYGAPTAMWERIPLVHPHIAIAQTFGRVSTTDHYRILFEAIRRGLTTPSLIEQACLELPRIPARGSLMAAARAAASGAESYLEQVSLTTVFNTGRFQTLRRQHTLSCNGRRFRVDLYDPETKTAIECDGAAFHGRLEQREADLARDALLAGQGVLTVRLSYRDLTQRPRWCRDRVKAVLDDRRLDRL